MEYIDVQLAMIMLGFFSVLLYLCYRYTKAERQISVDLCKKCGSKVIKDEMFHKELCVIKNEKQLTIKSIYKCPKCGRVIIKI